MTITAVEKKNAEITVMVSRTNANRLKFGTHTLKRVLELEGYHVEDGELLLEDYFYRLDSVRILSRGKPRDRPTLVVDPGSSGA